VLAAYVSGHGFGHATRLGAVLREARALAPDLPLAVVTTVPEPLLRRAFPLPFSLWARQVDVGVVQRDALVLDEAATAAACTAFEASWEARVEVEAAFLRASGARAVVADLPPLAFAAAARVGLPAVGLANFSWDWVYRHLAPRAPGLAASAARAARAYGSADLLLELPFAGDLSVFPLREPVGLVARRPRVARAEARRRLGLDGRPAVLLSFGGIGLSGGSTGPGGALAGAADLQVVPEAATTHEALAALGLDYPDVVGASDVVVTKPGYGIVSDAIAAGTRLVYTERGDFPEYPILVRELAHLVAAEHVSNVDLRAGRVVEPIRRVLARPTPPPPDLGGGRRAAERLLGLLGRRSVPR
jgi:L-arabinokinase